MTKRWWWVSERSVECYCTRSTHNNVLCALMFVYCVFVLESIVKSHLHIDPLFSHVSMFWHANTHLQLITDRILNYYYWSVLCEKKAQYYYEKYSALHRHTLAQLNKHASIVFEEAQAQRSIHNTFISTRLYGFSATDIKFSSWFTHDKCMHACIREHMRRASTQS